MTALSHDLAHLTMRMRELFDALEAEGGWADIKDLEKVLFGWVGPNERKNVIVLVWRTRRGLEGTGWSIEVAPGQGAYRLVFTEARAA